MANPTSIGGAFQRNVTSLTFHPSAALPAGALLFLSVGTNAPDTATITIQDTQGNNYQTQVASQQPGTSAQFLVNLVVPQGAKALTTADTITLTSSARADFAMSGYFFTGVQGGLFSSDVEWFNATNLSYSVNAQAGMQLFATLGVAGPSTDTFTQDAAWGPDVLSGIATTTFTVHASGRLAPTDGAYTWNPTLGTARRSVGLLVAFN